MMKRKWIGIVLIVCLLSSLTGCNSAEGNPSGGSGGDSVQISVADLPPSSLGDGFCFVGEEMKIWAELITV